MGFPRIALAPVAAVLLFAACGDDGSGAGSESADTVRLWVQPELVECEGGAGPQTCLLIAESEDGEATLFYDSIEGFTFEAGTAYVIDVTVADVENPPADGSSLSYTLVEIVEEN